SFTLSNGSFTTADFTGVTTVVIPSGSNTFSTTITLIDDAVDDGDELAIIRFGSIPATFNRRNDNVEIRVVDNDFTTATWGTPLNPTYGMVSSTAPEGYYDTLEGKSGEALRIAVRDLVADPSVVRAHTYG